MVSAGISCNGKTNIYLIETYKTKMNCECYINLPDDGLIPDCRHLYPENISFSNRMELHVVQVYLRLCTTSRLPLYLKG